MMLFVDLGEKRFLKKNPNIFHHSFSSDHAFFKKKKTSCISTPVFAPEEHRSLLMD